MQLSFFETMQGDLVDGDGRSHLADFEIKAEAASVARLARTGELRLTGVMHAPPWADHSPLDGTLKIRPVGHRSLEYDVRFTGSDGAAYDLHGRKDLRGLDPLGSMTTMRTSLRRGADLVAEGILRFDLYTLGAFLASAWPASSMRQPSMVAPTDGVRASSPVSEREREILRALGRAVITPGEHVPAPDEATVQGALDQLACMPSPARAAWRAGLATLSLAVRARTGRSMTRCPPDRLRALLERWSSPTAPADLRRALDFVTMPYRSAHFARPDYLESVGYPDLVQTVREQEPRFLENVVHAESLDAETTVEAEVVVVGTGAGGAAVAAALAERGVAVALVEEGRYRRRADFSGSPSERMRRLYRDRGMTFTLGRPPISIPMGRMVGGTTAINSGTCLRAPDDVLHDWRERLGLPEGFDPEGFAAFYERVDQALCVTPNAQPHLGRIGDVMARGADALGLPHGPLPRNAPDCDGQGTCILGCPTGAKRSTDVSFVPRALRRGAALFTGLPVTRVLMRGRRAVGVEARGHDRHGAPKVLRVLAKGVVLACGSLITPSLLMENGFRLPWLGRNLSLHPGLGMLARFDEVMEPWHGIPQGYAVHGFGTEGFVFEGVYLPPNFLVPAMPFLGDELTRWMDAHASTAQFGFMVRDGGDGRVLRSVDGAPLVRYKLSRRSLARIKKASALLAEMLLRGGAREVMTGIGCAPVVRSQAEARALADAPVAPIELNLLGAHPLGTCRMGRSEADAVVDGDHRVFGTANLHVVDGGAVPTSLGVNPQMTIMAMALRAGDRLAERYG